jgi:RNA-directed DNA polymerase
VKALQRFISHNVLSNLPVHSSATAYVKGVNIRENAAMHRTGRTLLKLDFKDFFPSLTVLDWAQYARRHTTIIDPSEVPLYRNVLFWGKGTGAPICLSIGAPTSPIVSNLLLYDLDTELQAAAHELDISYTRYADDITVSGPNIEDLRRFERRARSIVSNLRSPRLRFNDEKRGIYSMGQRRMVTGLILTPQDAISIGRDRKRLISAMIHRASIGKINAGTLAQLKGFLGFCADNEPEFISRLRRKYGNAVVDGVLRYEIPRS